MILDSYRDFFEQKGAGKDLDALLTGAESGSAWTLLNHSYQVVTTWSDKFSIPLVYPFSGGGDSPMDEFIDHWVMLKQHDGAIDAAYQYWILGCLLIISLTVFTADLMGGTTGNPELGKEPGFSFDCDNTLQRPCRRLVADYNGKPITIEPSSVAWSDRYHKAIVVSDNYNDLVQHKAVHYVIVYFGLEENESKITVKPLLTPEQAVDFPLYDLEGITLQGDRLYTIGSLALHGKDPSRDRWERHQFVQMELRQIEKTNMLGVENLSHVTRRWPNFRDWLISKSGHTWSAEETRGRAEAEGINIEALSITDAGTVMMGFRGPLTPEGGAMAIEFKLPDTPDHEPVLVRKYALPQLDFANVPKGTPKILRAMVEVPGKPGDFYVLLGPKGYEKEEIVISNWNTKTGQLSRTTQLPEGFVAEGVAPISEDKLLIVDDLKEMIIIATKN